MEAREPRSLDVLHADGTGLQVQFVWRQDRHAHTISLLVDGCSIPILESVEGSNVDDWPPSPPLQQLSVEEPRPEMQVALLVGMAGKSHWSMSVEPVSDRAALVFDVACRSPNAVKQLGSGYLLLADGFTTDGDHGAVIDIEGRSLQIRCDRDGPTAAMVMEGPHGLRIVPTAVILNGTTRWRYSLELP